MYQIFLIQIAFSKLWQRRTWVLRFCNQNTLNFKYRETKKIQLSFQGTYNFQILGNEILIIADYKYAKVFKFATLDIKL